MTFVIRWIVYHHGTDMVETETVDGSTLSTVVKQCEKRLDEVRLRHSDNPPNGFQILSEDGAILRQIVDRTK
jgi:hypothetical protein